MEIAEIRKIFPRYYDNVREIDELCKAYKWLIDLLIEKITQIKSNLFLTEDTSLSYIREMELFFGITPKDTLSKEERLFNLKLLYTDKLPYNYYVLQNLLETIIGNKDVYISLYQDSATKGHKLIIKVGIKNANKLDMIKQRVRLVVPAHIFIQYDVDFETYGGIKNKRLRYGDLYGYSYQQIKMKEVT